MTANTSAAERAGVTVRELATPAACEAGADLLREVWRSAEAPVPSNLLRTVQHIGGYVFGAYDESGSLLAASMGMLGNEGLHSHITGVVPAGQRRGLGFALKQHQRTWALERGIRRITWTCDPLVRRNVAFNLRSLGAHVVHYLPDHYGAMPDAVNQGDESDRLELHWDLLSPRAVAAAEGRLEAADVDGLDYAVREDHGLPQVGPVSGSRLVQLPADIEAIRQADPAAGRAWRRAVRDAVLPALSEGAQIGGITADGALLLEAPHLLKATS
jgi:predicted GNAT superfamily acetyltransferase